MDGSSGSARSSCSSRPNTTQEQRREIELPSAAERRRSLISERPKTSTSAILRSYSCSSFESPDEDEEIDSEWDIEEEISTQSTREVS